MSDKHLNWRMDGRELGWTMPSAPLWKRRPIIRHVRAMIALRNVQKHNAFWRGLGQIPTGYDDWVVYGIWHGMEPRP